MCPIQQIAHAVVFNFRLPDPGRLTRMPNVDIDDPTDHAVLRFDGWGSFAEYATASDCCTISTSRKQAIEALNDMLKNSTEDWTKAGDLPEGFDMENSCFVDAFGNLHLVGEWCPNWKAPND